MEDAFRDLALSYPVFDFTDPRWAYELSVHMLFLTCPSIHNIRYTVVCSQAAILSLPSDFLEFSVGSSADRLPAERSSEMLWKLLHGAFLLLSFKAPWCWHCSRTCRRTQERWYRASQGSTGLRQGCLHAPACWVFGLKVESHGGWEGAFILAEGQPFLYTFFWKNVQDGVCFITPCDVIHPGQVGFMAYHVFFNQAQSP